MNTVKCPHCRCEFVPDIEVDEDMLVAQCPRCDKWMIVGPATSDEQ